MGLKLVDEIENTPIYEAITSELEEIKVVEIDVDFEKSPSRIPAHWHRSLEIVVPISNDAYLYIENERHLVYANTYYIVNSRSIHSFGRPDYVQSYHGYALQIGYNFLKKIYPEIDDIQFESYMYHKEVYKVIMDIIQAYHSDDPFKNMRMKGLSYVLMGHLFAEAAIIREQDNTNRKHNELMMNITKFVDENYASDITVDTIADTFNLSYGYLSTIFKQYMGYGVKEYINYIRVKKSEKDLLDKSLTITAVYTKNGFTNSKSYYREFRKYHGISPKEYREKASL